MLAEDGGEGDRRLPLMRRRRIGDPSTPGSAIVSTTDTSMDL